MKRAGAGALAGILFLGILTIWVEARWAWSLFQIAVFALAGWRIVRGPRVPVDVVAAALAALGAAAVWPFVQLAAGSSVSRAETWSHGMNWCTFFLVFACSWEILAEADRVTWFLRLVTGFGTMLAFVSTVQNYSSGGKIFWLVSSGYDRDVFGPFVYRNQFAAWVELLLPVALYLALTDRRLRMLYGCAAAVLFSSIVASASRAGSVVACGEVLVVLTATVARRAAPRKALVLVAVQFLALAAGAVAIAGWEGLAGRWESGGPMQADPVRVDAVRASVQMVRDRPWMGSGLGTWPMVYPQYAGFDAGVYVNQAHNDWIQWAAEGGAPFVFLLASFALLSWKPALQSIYGVGTLAFLLHALVDYPMQQRPALAAWFFALAGAAMARPNERTRDI